jgi:hypothetical protein
MFDYNLLLTNTTLEKIGDLVALTAFEIGSNHHCCHEESVLLTVNQTKATT